MKILQINAVSTSSSTGRTTKELHEYLNEHGHNAYIAYSKGADLYNGFKLGSFINNKIHSFLSRVIGLQGYYSKYSTKKLIKFIEKKNIELIHLRNLHANFIHLPLLLSFLSKKNIPTVLTLHDCWFYTGKCCHYTSDNCYKWKTGCHDCIRLHKDINSLFIDRTNKMWCDKKILFENIPKLAVVGVSQWIANEAKDSFLSCAKEITAIYNWIDTDKFYKLNSENIKRPAIFKRNDFIILGVASFWSNDKGLDKFIELSKLISDDMKLILVGYVNENISLPNNIYHVDRTNSVEELNNYYNLANVFLQLSYEESFGKVTAEALSCGTPAIVIDSTASPELINKKCGYVLNKDFTTCDVLDKCNKVKNLGKEHFSESCGEYAKHNFNKEDRIKDYITLYEKLLKDND